LSLVAGAVAIVVVLLVIPVLVLMAGAVGAALLGWLLARDAQERYRGNELLDVNT
jgi:hypothetical protein